jgi:transcription elongation factor SPT6
MKKRLMVRPFEPSDGGDAHIVSIWVENGMDAIAHIVALDENGELVDKTQGYCKRQEKDVQKLTNTLFKFLQEHSQTHAVVINLSAGMKCMDMGELVDAVRRQLGRDVASRFGNDDGTDYFDICFLKDDVPLMYSRSKRAEQEYPEESESFRAAIALGRYLKNPASELCAMWGSVPFNDPSRGHELLFLNLHPLQHSLVKDAILKEYDRIFLQVVNKFGVDINLLANHKHTSYQLQFICGLGPVKASYVLDKVRAKSIIERRQELLSKGFVSKVVYRNCAGFIRIRERDALKDSPLNPLDDTRIHPESYYMAVKMCGDANNNSTIDMYDPNQYSYAVEDTMFQSASAIKARNAPLNARLDDAEIQDALAELDLPAYAARLELQKKGPKLLTLEYIKRELRYPYFDKREKYQVPKDEELFFLLNGETKDTLRVGMIVPCTLVNPTGDFVRVRLQNGVRSSLRRENLPDYMTKDWLRINGFPKGLTVNAKILSFKQDNFNRYEAILGCDSRSLTDVAMCFNPHLFPEYTRTQSVINDSVARIDKLVNQLVIEENDEGYDQEIRRPTQPKRKKRQIAHPLFRNINCKAAMDYLREQPIGDVIIRPSAKGTDHLTLTWKMLDGVYRHFEIEEREKPSDTRIGAKLVIKDQVYENIDELIARFVDPMNEFVDEVIRYKYYKSVSQEEVREELIKQKKSNPSSIPYALHVYNKFPGCFSITFIARVTPHSCHMEVKPNGYRFFGRIESSTLPTLREALQFFKMKALVAPQTSSSTRDSSYSSTSLKRDSSAPFSSESSSRGRDQSYSNGSSYDSGRSDSRYSHQGSHPDSRYDSRRDDRYGGPSRGDNRYHGQGSRYRNDLPVGGGGRRW